MSPEPSVPPPGFADISVITPALNASGTVARTLASIAAQTVRPREVIVVDDGSTDGTADAAEAFAPRMRGIALTVLRQKTAGAAAARNAAIRVARREWLALLDADDEWLPTKIERCMDEIARCGADMAMHNYVRVEGRSERAVDCVRHVPPGADPFVAQLLFGFISSTAIIVRRGLVLRAGGFDPQLRSGHDYELWLAVLALPGVKLCAIPEPLSRYHITPNSVSSNVDLRREAALRALARHWRSLYGRIPFPASLAAVRAVVVHMQAARMNIGAGKPGAALMEVLAVPRSLARLFSGLETSIRPNSFD